MKTVTKREFIADLKLILGYICQEKRAINKFTKGPDFSKTRAFLKGAGFDLTSESDIEDILHQTKFHDFYEIGLPEE